MANWRGNLIVEAQLHVIVLLSRAAAEGHSLRRPVELLLVRDRNPTFVLTWTAMHAIDEKSPFFGVDPVAFLRDSGNAQIVLSLTGLDETAGQTIHARYAYGAGRRRVERAVRGRRDHGGERRARRSTTRISTTCNPIDNAAAGAPR